MKKFLISMIIGATCLAMGATLLFFEVKDFDIVNGCDIYDEDYYSTSKTLNAEKENVKIILKDDFSDYDITYDDAMKNEVKIELSNDVEYELEGNRMSVYGRNNDHRHYRANDVVSVMNKVLDGLKDHKVYQCNGFDTVRIRMAREMKDRVEIVYE